MYLESTDVYVPWKYRRLLAHFAFDRSFSLSCPSSVRPNVCGCNVLVQTARSPIGNMFSKDPCVWWSYMSVTKGGASTWGKRECPARHIWAWYQEFIGIRPAVLPIQFWGCVPPTWSSGDHGESRHVTFQREAIYKLVISHWRVWLPWATIWPFPPRTLHAKYAKSSHSRTLVPGLVLGSMICSWWDHHGAKEVDPTAPTHPAHLIGRSFGWTLPLFLHWQTKARTRSRARSCGSYVPSFWSIAPCCTSQKPQSTT